jgi:hypothetical protein
VSRVSQGRLESDAEHIHTLLMELVRAGGMLEHVQSVPDHQISLSAAFALHELDTGTPLSQRNWPTGCGWRRAA